MNIKDKLISLTDEVVKLPNIDGNFKKYKVNINHLFFNPYNDRFAMEISEAQTTIGKTIGYDDESQKSLEKLLWDSTESKNRQTMEDILKNGIIREIVIDLSGTILDGNRRVAITKRILQKNPKDTNIQTKFSYIEVVLVEKNLTPKQIHEFETTLQMSEDEKQDYDPINVYLKIQKLYDDSLKTTHSEKVLDVKHKMGAKYKTADIAKKIDIFKEMQAYLSAIGKSKRWGLLKDRGDMFERMHSLKQNWTDKKIVVEYKIDFKNYEMLVNILYKFIALKLEVHKFREIVPGIKNTLKSPLSTEKGLKDYSQLMIDYKVVEMYDEYIKCETISEGAIDAMKNVISIALKRLENSGKSLDVESAVNTINSSSDKILDWVTKKGIVTLSPSQREKMVKEIENSIAVLERAKKELIK